MTASRDAEQALIESDIEEYLARHERKELLRFLTCGSVDDGKSTLIGRMLFDSKQHDEAVAIFVDVQQKYPQSDQAVNATVNIGAAHMAQEEYRQAGAVFQSVVEKWAEVPKYAPQVDFARQQLEAMQEARVL